MNRYSGAFKDVVNSAGYETVPHRKVKKEEQQKQQTAKDNQEYKKDLFFSAVFHQSKITECTE
jgi:hypothetical protein